MLLRAGSRASAPPGAGVVERVANCMVDERSRRSSDSLQQNILCCLLDVTLPREMGVR